MTARLERQQAAGEFPCRHIALSVKTPPVALLWASWASSWSTTRTGREASVADQSALSAPSPAVMEVLIVEGHELLAQTLTLALRADGFYVELADDLSLDGVVHAADRMRPTLVLLGLDLAEHGSALPYIAPLGDLGCCVVMLTHATNEGRLGRCMAAGAVGVALTSAPLDDLIVRLKESARMWGAPSDR